MQDYVLTTAMLSKHYGRSKVLSDVSLHVPKGSVYGIVGKNGAGKTTLIRLICGLQEPTSGSFTLYGADKSDRQILRARRRMGAVIETPAIYLDMTAEDNLKQQCLILGLPTYDSIPEVLSLVGLSDTGRKKAKHFSLGMKQRLGIAVALMGDPDLLILDEPTNGLDPQGIVEIRELILKLNRERNITVMIASHILNELSRVATHYGFLNEGRLVKEIATDDLEAACRKCLAVTVNDTKLLALVLDEMGVEYEILSEREAYLYGEISPSSLVLSLSKRGGELLSSHERNETLETYFINLVGGKQHD